MEPVAIPAPAQVAAEGVDTFVLAPAVVLGALVLVCGDQRTLLRGTTNLGTSLTAQNPAQKESPPGSLPDCPNSDYPSTGPRVGQHSLATTWPWYMLNSPCS